MKFSPPAIRLVQTQEKFLPDVQVYHTANPEGRNDPAHPSHCARQIVLPYLLGPLSPPNALCTPWSIVDVDPQQMEGRR